MIPKREIRVESNNRDMANESFEQRKKLLTKEISAKNNSDNVQSINSDNVQSIIILSNLSTRKKGRNIYLTTTVVHCRIT